MDSGFATWVSWFAKFIYNALFTVKVPGLNMSFVMLFICVALLKIFIKLVVSIIFQSSGSVTSGVNSFNSIRKRSDSSD